MSVLLGGIMYSYMVSEGGYTLPNGKAVLSNLNFTVKSHEKTVILGANGSGKSTLLKALGNQVRLTRGNVSLFDAPIVSWPKKQIHAFVRPVDHAFKPSLFHRTIWEYITHFLIKQRLPKRDIEDKAKLLLCSVDLYESRSEDIKYLSRTDIKKLQIAAALCSNPKIMLIDDPFIGLDANGYSQISYLLESLHLTGITIIVATHDVDFTAVWADSVIVLKDGGIVAAGTAELTVDQEVMASAALRLPMLSLPFTLMKNVRIARYPRTLQETVRLLYSLHTTQMMEENE